MSAHDATTLRDYAIEETATGRRIRFAHRLLDALLAVADLRDGGDRTLVRLVAVLGGAPVPASAIRAVAAQIAEVERLADDRVPLGSISEPLRAIAALLPERAPGAARGMYAGVAARALAGLGLAGEAAS